MTTEPQSTESDLKAVIDAFVLAMTTYRAAGLWKPYHETLTEEQVERHHQTVREVKRTARFAAQHLNRCPETTAELLDIHFKLEQIAEGELAFLNSRGADLFPFYQSLLRASQPLTSLISNDTTREESPD